MESLKLNIFNQNNNENNEQVKKIKFINPKNNSEIPLNSKFFDFCGENKLIEYQKYYNINNKFNPYLNEFFLEGNKIEELLNEYFKNNLNNNNQLFDYIIILYQCSKIFFNNSLNFEYSNGDEIIKSSSFDFELCMCFYKLASEEQLKVNDDNFEINNLKNNTNHLILTKKYLEKAYLIAKNCLEKLDDIDNNNNNENNKDLIFPYNLILSKRFIINVKTNSINNKNVDETLLQSNKKALLKWINDIGGIDIMKTRYYLALCQANENFYKAMKITSKKFPSKKVSKSKYSDIAYGISQQYKEIFSKNNGILNDERYNNHIFKIFSKFMYNYYLFISNKILFNDKCSLYLSTANNLENDDFLDYFNDKNEILKEYFRFNNIINKKYETLLIIIKKNQSSLKIWEDLIIKKFKKCEDNFNLLIEKLKTWSLNINDNSENINYKLSIYKDFKPTLTILDEDINIDKNIENSLKKFDQFETFFNFCNNKGIQNNFIIKEEEEQINNNNNENDYNLRLKKLNEFKNQYNNWQNKLPFNNKNNISFEYKRGFIDGQITERFDWCKSKIIILNKNKHIIDYKSLETIEKSIVEFNDLFK